MQWLLSPKIAGHVFVVIYSQKWINLAFKNHKIQNDSRENKVELTALRLLKFTQNSRVNKVEQVHDAIALKDFQIANEKSHFETSKEEIFERLFGDCMIFFRTTDLKGFHEKTVEEPPSNHHEYKYGQTYIDEIKILRKK